MISIMAAGVITLGGVCAVCFNGVHSVYKSISEMHQNLNGLYNCFAVDLHKVGEDLKESNRQAQKKGIHLAKIEGSLEQLETQINECNKNLIQKLDSF